MCIKCQGNTYKTAGTGKCKDCIKPFITDNNRTKCFNPEIEIELAKFKKQLIAQKEKQTMLREMEMLLDKVGDTHIQNQQINIHINSYGNENLDYITNDDIN